MSARDTLSNPIVFRSFVNSILARLRPEADSQSIEGALEDVDKTFTVQEAIIFLETTDDPAFAFVKELFINGNGEDPIVERLQEDIQTLRGEGISDQQIAAALRKAGLEIARPTAAGLTAARREISNLQEQIKKEREGRPKPVLTQDEEDALFEQFKNRLTKGLKRPPVPRETDRFEGEIEIIRKAKLQFSQARNQILELADAIVAESPGRPTAKPPKKDPTKTIQTTRDVPRFSRERLEELINKDLEGLLNDQERAEMDRLLLELGISIQEQSRLEGIKFSMQLRWVVKIKEWNTEARYIDEAPARAHAEKLKKMGLGLTVTVESIREQAQRGLE